MSQTGVSKSGIMNTVNDKVVIGTKIFIYGRIG
jgi:hypothetical protein